MAALRVCILGGGVAGLSAALALYKRAGVRDLRVFEREEPTSFEAPAGHGLMLMQNGAKALATLGVSVLGGCTPLTRALFQDSEGAAIRSEPLAGVYCVTRTAIVQGLRAALPAEAMVFNRRVERVELSEPLGRGATLGTSHRRVRAVYFQSGPPLLAEDFDVVVGAEGVRSPLSDALNPGLERPRSRVMEIVTSTELPDLAAQLGGSFVKTLFSDRGLAFGLLAPTPSTVIGFLQFDSERHALPAGSAGSADFERFLFDVLAGAPEPIPTYLRHADFASAHLWLPVNADLPRVLHCGNAVLVGDAGHPLLPFTSQGASSALEDAVILSDVLASGAHPTGGNVALSGFCEDRCRDLTPFIDAGRLILANFLDSSSGFVAPYVDGAASKLEEHLSLPRGGLRALFRVLDLDGSGRLDEAEFRHALDLVELSPAVDETRRLFAEIDADGDGALTLEEFVLALGSDVGGSELLRRVRAGLTPRRVQLHTLKGRCRAWFRTMDEDNDRAIDFSEFASGLLFLGIEMGGAECRQLFDELDENHDGKIDFEEFSRGAARRLGSLERAGSVDGAAADPLFSDAAVNLAVLKRRAYNYRWAVQAPDVIPLTAADPDFPVAPEIIRAIEAYVKAGHLSYGPAEGLPDFRNLAAERLSARRGIGCSPDRVFVADGAASALFLVARFALKQPGDEAIVFDPVDFLFERSAHAAGGIVKRLPLRKEREYSFDPDELESLVTPRTRLLSICSPHNPLGRVWTRKELEQLTAVAVRHDLWILSDEVWSDIVYPPHRHISTASLDPEIQRRTFSIFGFSKSYGLAGLRLGLLISPNHDIHRAIVRISHADDTAYGVSTLSQVAGMAAYGECDAWLERFLVHLQSQRDYAVDRLNRMGAPCGVPQGTYVLFADVSAIASDASVLTERLLAHNRVAVVPGSPAFFGPRAEGHLRISFATSRSILKEGLDRLEVGLEDARTFNAVVGL